MTEKAKSGVGLMVPDWRAPQRVRAAFTLRTGGTSAAPFDSFNLGSAAGDDPDTVRANQRLLRQHLALPEEPAWLEQVHGSGVLDLDAPTADASRVADAAVTRTPGRVCAVRVADCMPVLFTTRGGRAIGAAHAGWRGLAAGVLEATVTAMYAPGEELLAWMGPCIGQAHFEVGDEVRAAFTGPSAAQAFVRNARGRWQCDLASLARARLTALDIREIDGGHWCTHSDAARFYSFRRDGKTGRMAALIWMSGQ